MKIDYSALSAKAFTKKLAACLEGLVEMQDCLLGIEENARAYRRLLREARALTVEAGKRFKKRIAT